MFNQIPRKSYQFLFLVLALAMMILPFGVAHALCRWAGQHGGDCLPLF